MFLFLSMAGLSPEQSLKVVKAKIEQVVVDTVGGEEQASSLTTEMRGEIDKTRNAVTAEIDELQQQKDSLSTEKAQLEALKNEIDKLLSKKSKAEEDRMYSLAKIYDGMDQEKVADVFSQMQDSLIIALLPKMKSNNASLVLEFLPPGRSANISKMMLEGR